MDLPKVGQNVKKGESFSSVKSVKAVSDVYSPIDGKVVEVNAELSDSPDIINKEPHQLGWMIAIEPSDPKQLSTLMDATAYSAYLSEISK